MCFLCLVNALYWARSEWTCRASLNMHMFRLRVTWPFTLFYEHCDDAKKTPSGTSQRDLIAYLVYLLRLPVEASVLICIVEKPSEHFLVPVTLFSPRWWGLVKYWHPHFTDVDSVLCAAQRRDARDSGCLAIHIVNTCTYIIYSIAKGPAITISLSSLQTRFARRYLCALWRASLCS